MLSKLEPRVEAYFSQPFVFLGVGATRVNLEDDYLSLDRLTHEYQFLKPKGQTSQHSSQVSK